MSRRTFTYTGDSTVVRPMVKDPKRTAPRSSSAFASHRLPGWGGVGVGLRLRRSPLRDCGVPGLSARLTGPLACLDEGQVQAAGAEWRQVQGHVLIAKLLQTRHHLLARILLDQQRHRFSAHFETGGGIVVADAELAQPPAAQDLLGRADALQRPA